MAMLGAEVTRNTSGSPPWEGGDLRKPYPLDTAPVLAPDQ